MTCLPPIYSTMALSPVASDIDRWSVASRVSPGTVSVTMVNGSPRSALTASWTVAKLSRTYYAHAATDSPGLDRANRGYLLSMLLERLPEVQSLAPEDKWRLIDEFGPTWRGRLKVQGQRTISSSLSRNVFRIICSTLLKGKGRTKSSHDWRNINASGNNLSSRSGGR